MLSIKRQAASKARQNQQQQGDSTRSLSSYEKSSCDFYVRHKFRFASHIQRHLWARVGWRLVPIDNCLRHLSERITHQRNTHMYYKHGHLMPGRAWGKYLLVPGCTASRGEASNFTHYCAFDSDHYHDGFIVPGIWQTKSRKWLGVTQGIWRGMWGRALENTLCVSRGAEGGGRSQGKATDRQTDIYCMFQSSQIKTRKDAVDHLWDGGVCTLY